MNYRTWIPILLAVLAVGSRHAIALTPAVSAADETEEIGKWSGIVGGVRGRLIAVPGIDLRGTTSVHLYLELENLDWQPIFGKRISFNRDTSLTWALTDSRGRQAPEWKGQLPWIFDYSSLGYWLSIPGGGKVRVPVCEASYYLYESAEALVMSLGLVKTRPWHLVTGGREYFLSASFKGLEKNKEEGQYIWCDSLSLPPVQLPPDPTPIVWSNR